MISDKKNIDRLYQEKFKNLEVEPSDAVWENISAQLHSKKKRRVIPFWIRLSGAAAILLLFIALSNVFFNTKPGIPTETIVNSNNQQTPENNIQKSINDLNSNSSNNNIQETVVVTPQSTTNKSQKNQSNNSILANKSNAVNSLAINEKLSNTETTLAQNKNNVLNNLQLSKEKTNNTLPIQNDVVAEAKTILFEENPETNSIADEAITSLVEDTNPMDDTDVNKPIKETTSRWSVAPTIAPVYFNTLGSGSSIHSQFDNNSKTGDINMSYGVSASYAINEKINIRAGINKVKLGYSTNNVVVFDNTLASSNILIKNVNLKTAGQNMAFISANNFSFSQAPEALINQFDAAIDQQFGFIEVPVEIEYSIFSNNLGVSVIGGFSTLILNENDIYSTQNGQSILLGSATNINKMSYSANLGLGLDLKISKKINFNFEPMFKYQLNTFNNTTGNFKPYFIGIYSGFGFKF